jgi:hypothetical protein
MHKKHYKILIYFQWLLIVLIMLILLGCDRVESTTLVSENTKPQVLSVTELYPQAEKAALEWQEDAYLANVILDVFPASKTSSSSADFIFRSHTFPEIYFSYNYTVNKTTKISQSEGKYPTPRPPDLEINPETLPFDSLDAINIMYDGLGKEIYSDCNSGTWPDLLRLEHRIPGLVETTWGISFTCTSPQNWGAIIISAETGEVLEIRK